jgi:hypothetical protein
LKNSLSIRWIISWREFQGSWYDTCIFLKMFYCVCWG